MMREGRLVWHHAKRPHAYWYTFAHANERVFYVIAPDSDGGWRAKQSQPEADTPLGWFPKLAQAKLAVDHDHHARIRNSNDAALKDHIRRFPLQEVCP